MTHQELKAIVNNMDAEGYALPVKVRVDFCENNDRKSFTIADVSGFHQWSDAFQLNVAIDDDVKNKLMKFREWLISETDRFEVRSNAPDASKEGSQYDRGTAFGLIHARDKLEKLFDYWDCR